MWLNDSTEKVSRHWVNMCVVNSKYNTCIHHNTRPSICKLSLGKILVHSDRYMLSEGSQSAFVWCVGLKAVLCLVCNGARGKKNCYDRTNGFPNTATEDHVHARNGYNVLTW